MANPTSTKLTVPCYKCNGSRTIAGCGHINDGKCFTCHGSGTVDVDAVPAADMTIAFNSAFWACAYADEAMGTEGQGWRIEAATAELFKIGTRGARFVLGQIGPKARAAIVAHGFAVRSAA